MNPQFEVIITADQSPSIHWNLGQDLAESMHSRAGAWSETLYIYEPILDFCVQHDTSWSLFSLGLGLGYNEVMSAGYFLNHNPTLKLAIENKDDKAIKNVLDKYAFQLHSFESENLLTESLKRFLSFEYSQLAQTSAPPKNLESCYSWILEQTAARYNLQPRILFQFLKFILTNNHWQILPAINPDFKSPQKYSGIFYDAYSSKSSPHLWQEVFLDSFFESSCKEKCCVSTYAATGSLKRALNNNQFEVNLRSGFAGKRNSTIAQRL